MSDQRVQWDEKMTGAGHAVDPDTLNRMVTQDHGNDGSHHYPGLISGMRYRQTGDDTIQIEGGSLAIGGDPPLTYRLDSAISFTFTSVGLADEFICVAQTGTTSNILTVDSFSNTSVAPTQNHAKGGGWYNGELRCIGWMPLEDDGDLRPVSLDNNELVFVDDYAVLETGSPATSFTTLPVGAGGGAALGVKQKIRGWGYIKKSGTANVKMLARSGGSILTDEDTLAIANQQVDNLGDGGEVVLYTNTTAQIEYKSTVASATVYWFTKGIWLPDGMGR